MKHLFTAPGETELTALDAFLSSPVRKARSMETSMQVGYLVALAIRPDTLMPSGWPPWVRDIGNGLADVQFTDLDVMENIIQMVMQSSTRCCSSSPPRVFDLV